VDGRPAQLVRVRGAGSGVQRRAGAAAPRSIRILRVNGGAEVTPRSAGPEPAPRAANETIRQRRFNVASR